MTDSPDNNWSLLVQSYAGPPAYYNHLTKAECDKIIGKLGLISIYKTPEGLTMVVDNDGTVTIFPSGGGIGTPQPQLKQTYKSAECYQQP